MRLCWFFYLLDVIQVLELHPDPNLARSTFWITNFEVCRMEFRYLQNYSDPYNQIFHLPKGLLTQSNWRESNRFLLLCILYLIPITFSFIYDHLYCIYQRFYSYLLWLFYAQLRFIVISHVGFKKLCLMKNHSWILTENFEFMIFVFDATTTRLTFYQLLRLRYVCTTTSNSCGFLLLLFKIA